MNKEKGLSLIELMITSFLSLCLLTTVGFFYLKNSEHFQYQQAFAHLQENTRAANHILQTEIRMAGYIGCLQASHTQNELDSNEMLQGFDATHLPAFLHGKVLANTDVISVRKVGDPISSFLKTTKIQQLALAKRLPLKVGDQLVISDCEHAEIALVKAISNTQRGQLVTLSKPLDHPYSKQAQAGRLETHYFYLHTS